MKHQFTLFTFFCFVIFAHGQNALTRSPGTMMLTRPEAAILDGDRDIVWQEDFSDGLAGWTTSESGNIAFWEYRGPATDPNNELGSRGSCALNNLGEPILSPTWTNGFVIFDSNWWDNPDNPCTPDFFGTGPAPAPHLATLTSPAINLSGNSSVALVFNQYLKTYTGETRIEVSIDGFNWTTVFVNSSTPNPTMPDAQQVVQISPWVAGQAYVQIRFVFDGFYYFWQIDDIEIIDTYANDLALRNSTYGDFDLNDPAHPTGFEYMEYTRYPDEMVPELKFSSTCDNLGGAMQSNCRLNVEVVNASSNSIIHSGQSEEGFVISPGSSMELRAGAFQMPQTVGPYHVIYETSQTETEEFFANNSDTMLFFINDVQYARDALFASAVYLGTPEYNDVPYELGNVFLITEENLSCHSISVGIGIGSSTPTSVYGRLYSFDIASGINATLIATTPPVAIDQSMFNAYGDQILINLTFDAPVAVSAGTAYFVAVGSDEGVDNFVCAMAGPADEATAFVRYQPSDWYYLDMLPMVRMNFGFFNDVVEASSSFDEVDIFPVPTSDKIWIATDQWDNERVIIRVLDQGGRMMRSEQHYLTDTKNIQLDVSGLSAGNYQLLITGERTSGHATFVRE